MERKDTNRFGYGNQTYDNAYANNIFLLFSLRGNS